MMRSIKFLGAVALALVLGAVTQVRADEQTKGTIKSVDTAKKEVVLKGVVKDTAYELQKDASVWLDGTRAKIGDLKADDRAIVLYTKSGEQLMATSIRALRKAEEATGTIRTTVGEKREIVIKGTVKDTTYELTKDAVIWSDGKNVKLSDIGEGDEVRLTYEQRGDHRMVNDVVVTKKK
jgi:Cu/Ag efflux protein CusF